MLIALSVLSLALLQETSRIPENVQAKQRLQEADQHYRLGTEALQGGRFAEAERELQETARLDPNSFLAYFSLGRAYIGLKRYDDAVQAYLACRPAWDRSVADRSGRVMDRESRLEDRIRELRDRNTALEDEKNRLTGPAPDRSWLQTEIESRKAAIRLLEQMRGTDHGVPPPPAEFSLALGSAYLRAGAIDNAEKALREALELRTKYGEAYNNLAVIAIKQGRFEEAEAHVKAAKAAGFRVHPQMVKDIEGALHASDK